MDPVQLETIASSTDHLFLFADSNMLIAQMDAVAAAACIVPSKNISFVEAMQF